MIYFLPQPKYRIFKLDQQAQWYCIRFGHEGNYHDYHNGLTPKRMVIELFKLNRGAGYYLIDTERKLFYFCGSDLESVRIKLESIKGLCRKIFINPKSPRQPPPLKEEQINPLATVDINLVFVREGNEFKSYDTKITEFVDPSDTTDLGITWSELCRRFESVNGGASGFYVYKSLCDEVLYFPTATGVREAIAQPTQ